MQVSTIQISAWTKRWRKGIFFSLPRTRMQYLLPVLLTTASSPPVPVHVDSASGSWSNVCKVSGLQPGAENCTINLLFLRLFWDWLPASKGFSIQTDDCRRLSLSNHVTQSLANAVSTSVSVLLPQLHLYPILVSLLPNTVFNTVKRHWCVLINK